LQIKKKELAPYYLWLLTLVPLLPHSLGEGGGLGLALVPLETNGSTEVFTDSL
jgi:hypothetical protein